MNKTIGISYGIVQFALLMSKPLEPVPPYGKSVTAKKDGELEMSFHMGATKMTIPDKPGGYIVSCGCGAGKTTNIKRIIRERYREGVLYCVDTKEELDKMEESLLAMGIPSMRIEKIHGDIEVERLKYYQMHPTIITIKPILLITHCRLFVDMINLFLLYHTTGPITFDGDFEKFMQRDDLRKWIFLDETPLMFKPFFTLRHSLLGYFNVKGRTKMEENYRKYVKDTKEDPFKAKNTLSEKKKELVFNLIPRILPQWKTVDKKKDLEISFHTSDLVQPDMKSHVIVFEGAGDILLRTSKDFQLIDIAEKYNTKVNFMPFEFSMRRKHSTAMPENDLNNIAGMVKEHVGKVLVVVWKTVGGEKDETKEDSGISRFKDDVRNQLIGKECPPEKFAVTYYGASNTKSTNEFRDFDCIILCGDWTISNDKVTQINRAYASSTSASDQKLWYFVQLLCRTSIRNHLGGEVLVRYSTDFSGHFIERLSKYLNNNQLTDCINKTGTWKDFMVEAKIRKPIQDQITELNKIDPKISDCILTNKPYKLTISLDRLYKILPRCEKKRKEYKSLAENLCKVGISLEIT